MNSGRKDRINKLTKIWDTSVEAPSFLLPLGRISGHAPSRSLRCWPTGSGSSCCLEGWSHSALSAENIMFLELDLSPPAIFEFERSKDPAEQDPRALHLERLMHLDSLLERPVASRVRKSRSW
uniref:Uncharacterized protein n=1 Tax=Otus sunia TaxID=257818 RepID=A0A8C8B711_9STRI